MTSKLNVVAQDFKQVYATPRLAMRDQPTNRVWVVLETGDEENRQALVLTAQRARALSRSLAAAAERAEA